MDGLITRVDILGLRGGSIKSKCGGGVGAISPLLGCHTNSLKVSRHFAAECKGELLRRR
jgi:hypothetical protein